MYKVKIAPAVFNAWTGDLAVERRGALYLCENSVELHNESKL